MALITPEFLQSKTYPALRDRLAFQHGGNLQAGVWDPTDFKAVQRAAGANMSVDVGAGFALVQATGPASNKGLYHVQNDALINSASSFTWPASNGSNPRIDQLFVEINDSQDGADASDIPVLSVVQGTATSGATLDNRTGAGAAPANSLRLADVLIPAAASTITTANIRDRRPWVRGINWYYQRTSGSYTTTSVASFVSIDAVNILPRFECSGFPIKISMIGRILNAGGATYFTPVIDGAAVAAGTNDAYSVDATDDGMPPPTMLVVPAAGSHTISVAWRTQAGTSTWVGSAAATPGAILIEEIIRPNASNT